MSSGRAPLASPRAPARAAARAALVGALLALAALAPPSRAQEVEDPSALVTPDSVFVDESQPGPQYMTTFDRDRSRDNWTQTLSYARNTSRIAMYASGAMTTQELTLLPNKSTFGTFNGHLDTKPTSHWVVSLDGRFDMTSSSDGTRVSDSRRDRLQLKTQYQINPFPSLSLLAGLSTEFQRDHDRTLQSRVQPANLIANPASVDTLFAQRDSSETTGRQDGLLAVTTWKVKPWLQLYGSASGSRLRPTQESIVRDFTTPLDGNAGFGRETRQTTSEPTNNSNYNTRLTFNKIPRSTTEVKFNRASVSQSYFDRDFRDQERAQYERTALTGHVDYGPFQNILISNDVGLIRSSRDFRLRGRSNSLVTTRQLTSTVARFDTTGRFGLSYVVSRSRNERQVSQNGIVVDRTLGGTFSRKMSSRLVIDGVASAGLQTAQYIASDQVGDQDIARSALSVGGGYRVTPACSTTVHFSTNRSHTVSIDPSASGSNSVQTTYQMNATLLLRFSPDLTIRQNYLVSADYRIFDFDAAEANNYLNRSRRIDTFVTDSLFSFAFLKLTHNFLFRDQGPYARAPGESDRTYRVTQENYEQTLALTGGFDVAGGIRFIATQSLYNQRNHFLAQGTRTNRNRFSLTAGVEVTRTLRDGSQIVGAVRHIGGYDEKLTPITNPNEESYWIAGATFQKQF